MITNADVCIYLQIVEVTEPTGETPPASAVKAYADYTAKLTLIDRVITDVYSRLNAVLGITLSETTVDEVTVTSATEIRTARPNVSLFPTIALELPADTLTSVKVINADGTKTTVDDAYLLDSKTVYLPYIDMNTWRNEVIYTLNAGTLSTLDSIVLQTATALSQYYLGNRTGLKARSANGITTDSFEGIAAIFDTFEYNLRVAFPVTALS